MRQLHVWLVIAGLVLLGLDATTRVLATSASTLAARRVGGQGSTPTPILFCTPTPFVTPGPGTVLPSPTPYIPPGPGTILPTPTSDSVVIRDRFSVGVDAPFLDPAAGQMVLDVAQTHGLTIDSPLEWAPIFFAYIPPDRVEAVRADPRVLAINPAVVASLEGQVRCP